MPPVATAPDITTYRKNRTGRSRPSPTNLPGTGTFPITAYLPVICMEGSRPLLAALLLPPISSAGWGHPALHRNRIKMCPQGLVLCAAFGLCRRHKLHLIYYLLSIIFYLSPNKKPPPLRGGGSGSHIFAYAKSGIKQCPGSSWRWRSFQSRQCSHRPQGCPCSRTFRRRQRRSCKC